MDTLVQLIAELVLPLGVVGLLVVYFLLNPEKVEKWGSILWRLLTKLPIVVKKAEQKYVQYDLQGRINDFTKRVRVQAPFLAESRVEIQWIDPATIKKSGFLADGRVILRLRATDDNDANFVHGSYLFVSTSLLHKAKRYISPIQRDAIDLYVTAKLLESEKPHIVTRFLDEYLHPRTAKEGSTVVELFDAFQRLRIGGIFYEVFLQELDFLGDKVFGGRRHDEIRSEVNDLVTFLDQVACRNIGQEVPLDFAGAFCRFGIVIVGKSFNMTPDGEVWSRFIDRHVTPQQMETLYLIGNWDAHDVIEAVATAVADAYNVYRRMKLNVQLYLDGVPFSSVNCLIVLRRKGASVFAPPNLDRRWP